MSLIITELNEALIEAGASKESAKAAAKSVADFKNEITEIKTELAVIKWGIALIIITTTVPFLKALIP